MTTEALPWLDIYAPDRTSQGPSGFARALGARLREVRRRYGLTLRDVQEQSDGLVTDGMLASYERGERSVTAERLVELAQFYGLAVTDLLPDTDKRHARTVVTIDIELLRVARLPHYQSGPLIAAARDSVGRRGTIASLGGYQVMQLARAYGVTHQELVELLARWDVVVPHDR